MRAPRSPNSRVDAFKVLRVVAGRQQLDVHPVRGQKRGRERWSVSHASSGGGCSHIRLPAPTDRPSPTMPGRSAIKLTCSSSRCAPRAPRCARTAPAAGRGSGRRCAPCTLAGRGPAAPPLDRSRRRRARGRAARPPRRRPRRRRSAAAAGWPGRGVAAGLCGTAGRGALMVMEQRKQRRSDALPLLRRPIAAHATPSSGWLPSETNMQVNRCRFSVAAPGNEQLSRPAGSAPFSNRRRSPETLLYADVPG
jgi:hypothetical protein